MASTQVLGYSSPTRGPVTGDTLGFNGTTSIIEREVGTEVLYLDPSVAVYTILSDKAGNAPTDVPRYEWYEKTLRDKTTLLEADNGDVEDATTNTSLGISGTDVIAVGDLVLNKNTDEIYLVTARTDGNTFTVVRASAGTSAAAATDADPLVVVGSAFAEGVDVPATDEWQEVHKYNLTQIFRRSFGSSATREATQTYFGRGFRDRLAKEKGIEFAMDIERAFIAGGRAEVQADGAGAVSAGTGVLRTTGGFLSVATTNVLDLAGVALSEPTFEDYLEDVFAHTASGDSRTLLGGPSFITVLDMLAVDKIRTVSDSSLSYGIAVRQWQTSHGTLNIVKHRILSDFGTAFARGALVIDPKKLRMRTLSGRATKLLKNRQSPGVDGWVDEYLCEVGAQTMNEEVHGVIKDAALAA